MAFFKIANPVMQEKGSRYVLEGISTGEENEGYP